MQRRLNTLRLFIVFGCLALVMIGGAGATWGLLVYANLRTSPSIPWALIPLCALLWLFWRYVGGWGWPRSTSRTRTKLLRANSVSVEAFAWSLTAGGLAIVALAGLWIVMFSMAPMPPNPLLPARFASSPLLIAAIIIGASLMAPIVEESAVRGYLQTILEREVSPLAAVTLSSAVFALAHVSQGVVWPKLLLYFLVGLTFGALALLNNSILPVIPVHMAADLAFFTLVWPYDDRRTLISAGGADTWFWIHCAQVAVFGAGSVFSFVRLRNYVRRAPPASAGERARSAEVQLS